MTGKAAKAYLHGVLFPDEWPGRRTLLGALRRARVRKGLPTARRGATAGHANWNTEGLGGKVRED